MIADETYSSINKRASVIVCEENKMKYIANNTKFATVYKFKIDGEVIRDKDQKRCDYLVENETSKDAYFVELKGADIATAYIQIWHTIRYFNNKLDGYGVHSRIVCSRVSTHDVNGSEYRKLKKECADIKKGSRVLQENI